MQEEERFFPTHFPPIFTPIVFLMGTTFIPIFTSFLFMVSTPIGFNFALDICRQFQNLVQVEFSVKLVE